MSDIKRADDVSFPTTRWSLVGRAETGGPDLAALLKRYWPALYAYIVLECKLPADKADDLLQGFTASKILEQHLLSRADAGRGRFRTFLLAALKNYLRDDARASAAQKRQPAEGQLVSIDDAFGVADPAESSDPFDIEWARHTLGGALQQMHDECVETQRNDLWELLRMRVIEPALSGTPPISYEQIVERFGFASPVQASNALITAKRMFARVLRATIQQYAPDAEAVEQEIADLRRVLADSGARVDVLSQATLPPESQ